MPSIRSSSSKTSTRHSASCPGWHCKLRRWTTILSGSMCTTRSRSRSARTTAGDSPNETSPWQRSSTKPLSSELFTHRADVSPSGEPRALRLTLPVQVNDLLELGEQMEMTPSDDPNEYVITFTSKVPFNLL